MRERVRKFLQILWFRGIGKINGQLTLPAHPSQSPSVCSYPAIPIHVHPYSLSAFDKRKTEKFSLLFFGPSKSIILLQQKIHRLESYNVHPLPVLFRVRTSIQSPDVAFSPSHSLGSLNKRNERKKKNMSLCFVSIEHPINPIISSSCPLPNVTG